MIYRICDIVFWVTAAVLVVAAAIDLLYID